MTKNNNNRAKLFIKPWKRILLFSIWVNIIVFFILI